MAAGNGEPEVDIAPPRRRRPDLDLKKPNYERHGVAELWLVDTVGSVVLVFRRVLIEGGSDQATRSTSPLKLKVGDTLTSPLLPGFEVAVGEIFAER